MSEIREWGDTPATWQDVVAVAQHGAQLQLSEAAWQRMQNARQIVEEIVASGQPAYGINTGLGALCNVILPPEALSQLSRNTLMSHACGVGPLLSVAQTRAIMCAAVANYSLGYSGISPDVVRALLAFINHGITPEVPSQGSVGYLTHMAHIGLALTGMGFVDWQGKRWLACDALAEQGIAAVNPGAKDGLCLVNGTPCMTGLSCLALGEAKQLMDWADVTGAMSVEALKGQLAAFDERVLALKSSPDVSATGQRLRAMLHGSAWLAENQGVRTQDALSLRSIPQIHGACRAQWRHVETQVNQELNAATDNPLVLGEPGNWQVVSQANPHGESVAMAADLLAIALAETGSVAERRLDRLINPLVSELPPFLVAKPGVNSGMMIAQYVAASLCGENRRLAQPAVLDNYITSGLQEDHLSMGTSAALKLLQVCDNTWQILGIEYLLAAQALELIGTSRLAPGTVQAVTLLRREVAFWVEDRWLAPEMKKTVQIMRNTPAENISR